MNYGSEVDCTNCLPGFVKNKTTSTCVDKDECRNSTTGVATNICGAALGCVNKFGSYQCLCPPGYGYRLAQKACFDTAGCRYPNSTVAGVGCRPNPCLTNLNACASKNNTQCVPFANMTGFTCNCIAGARLRAGGNGSCNVNPCSRNPCTRNNTVCAANADFSAFTCPCRLGSRNISNACVMNPCYSIYNDTGPCRTKPNRACVPSANYSSYTCPCIAGAKNVSNVCLLNPCNSTLACADVPNSVCQPNADYKNYTCACRPGFRAFGNRCRSDPCVPLSNATAPPCATKANTFCNATADWSNFTCPCQPFALLSAGSCKLNPCNSTRNNCTALPNTVCAATADYSSYTCPCKTGFARATNGTCVYNPCAVANPCPADPFAACVVNLNNTANCAQLCQAGYIRSAVTNKCVADPCVNGCTNNPFAICRPNANFTGPDCSMCKTGYLRDSKGICVAHPCFRLGPCGADLYASCTPTLSNVSVANCTQCRTAYVRNISAPGAICVPDVCYVNPCSDPGTNCVRSFTPSKANCVPKTGYIQNTVTAMWVPDPCLPSSTNVVCGGDINAVCRPTADFTGQDCYRCKAGYLRHPVNGTCVKNLCLEGCPEDPDAWCQHTPDYLDIDCSLCRTGYTKDGGDFCQVAPPTLELSSHLGSHTCVRHAQGLKCFGVGTGGVLGTGSTADVGDLPYEMGRNLSFVDVLGSNYSTVLDVAAGNAFACALLSPGNALRCWGQNANGQLGLPTAGGTLGAAPGQMGDALPLVNLGGANVTQLALGGDHACALLTAANGTTSVKCWGNNAVGQAGRVGFAAAVNTNGSTVADVALGPTANVSAVTQVVAGVGFTCALVQPYGRVKCWGTGLYNATVAAAAGVVGRAAGSMGSNLSFVNLGTSAAVLQLAAGSSHVCAVLSPGNRLKCWGRNAAGQLGLNDTVDRGNAAGDSSYGMGSGLPDVPLGANVSRIAKVEAGGSHTCVLTLPGNIVRCWGLNDKGQLGYGDTTTRRAPPTETVSISSVLNVTDVVAGDKHTCVVALPGSVVKCWGNGRAIGRGNGTANMGSGPGEMGAALLTLDFGWDPCYPDWCPGDPLAQCQPNANFTAPVCDTCQPSYAKDDGTCSVCDDGFVRNATDASCRSCPVFPGYSVQTHVDAEGPNLIDSYVDSPAQACSDSPHCLGFSLGQDGEFDTGYLKRSVAVTYMYRDICLYTRLELPDYDCPDVPGFTAARGVDLEGAAIGGVGGDLWVDDPATACAANPSCAFFSTGYEGDFSAGVLRTATSDPTVPYYGVCLYAKNTSPPPAPTAPPPNLFDPCDAAPCDADPNAVCVPSPDYSAFTCDCTSGFVRDPAGPAACVASTPCAPLTGYTVQPDADAPGTDLSSDLAYDPVADCNADPACMGFVTGVVEGVYDMAVLKSDVTFTSFARGMCLYSKLGGAAKAVQSPQPAAATPGSGAPQGAPTVAADDGTVPVPGVAPAPAPTPASSGPSSPSSGSGASSTGTIVGATVGAVGGATLLAAAVAAVVVAKRRRSHAGGGRAAGDSEQAGGGNGAPSRGKSGGVVGVGLEAEWRQLSVSKKAFGRTDSRVHSITSAQAPALGLDSPNGTTTTTATTASSAANTTDAANLDGVWGQMHAVVRSPPRPADGRVASLTTGMQRADSRTAQGQLLLPSASSPRGPRPESGERSRPAGAGGPAGGPY